MIDTSRSWVGSEVRADASRGYPSRYIRLTLGEPRRYVGGEYFDGEKTKHNMTPATARKLAKMLIAEARICEGAK
jgi:hypothetical protein